MEITATQNSHIQIPKTLLKSFSNLISMKNEFGKNEKPRMVYKLDMKGNISQVNIKKENTEFGYYEDLIESKILNAVENDFGNLKTRIIKALNSGERLVEFSKDDILTVKKFCSLCLVRSESFVNSVKEKSKFIELYANTPQNVIMYQYFKSPELVDKYIVGNNLSFVINDKDINYVLPRFYTVSILDNGISNFYIPITPKVLIRLTTEKMICGNTLYFGKMEITDVDNFNKYAIQCEFRNNKGAIYAQKEEDLKRYVSFVKNLNNNC